ncbi:hypothetical protein AA0111_g11324 [Alternaria arborescens]|uniref:hypothetical protein n=1 Tax=Alternaria arborescens TaxID=156630 RepID=UPI0010758AE4|nr:hypothetical protein AA0111_g11324 [Alternaria arborescens]RYO16646.1 hypothetical protein AA0111_g11324 [Alternaria arborescens]
MSKQVAITGGSGNVAQEVVYAILSRGNYKVVVLSRRDAVDSETTRVEWRKVKYHSHALLVVALDGIDTLLSFVATADMEAAFELQKVLIHAAIEASVQRRSESGIAHYAYKDETRKYLEAINKEQDQIEYCLFQPGFFTEYFAEPNATASHLQSFKMFADFEYRRAIILEGAEDSPLTLTTVGDMAKVVALALDYRGRWPTTGGIRGTQTTISGFLRLAERIRGPFQIERLVPDDVNKGELKASWYPIIEHKALPDVYREMFSKNVTREYVKSLAAGG